MAFTNDSNKLLVAVKAYSRGNALPLDNSEIYASKTEAEAYAASPIAYAGQTIKVLENGKYITYVLDPKDDGGFSLTRVGLDESIVTQVNNLEGLVAGNTASITGNGEKIEKNITDIAANAAAIAAEIGRSTVADESHASRIQAIEDDYLKAEDKEALEVAISAAEGRANAYADTAVANLVDGAPEALNTINELAAALKNNKDIVSVLESSIALKADASDLTTLSGTVTQNKIDTDAAIKVLQEKAASLESADTSILSDIAELEKLVEANTTAIATEKGRAEDAEAALETAINNVAEDLTTAVTEINSSLNSKALATDLIAAEKRITAVEGSLNSKVSVDDFNNEIGALETAISTQETTIKNYVDGRLDIEEGTTVKSYINSVVESGGVDTAEAIEKAKQEAISTSSNYTDTQLSWQSYN